MSEESNPVSRLAIGIDLGTTHCVLAVLQPSDEDQPATPEVFAIPQLVRPGVLEASPQLPSFLYLPHETELPESDRQLPWGDPAGALSGRIARHLGNQTPGRLVSSAKSWLGHAGIDCKQAFLPLEHPEDVSTVSPYEATVAYLSHLREAWNHSHPDQPLETQDVVVTVPASFDPAARDLTSEAARQTGLQNLSLLEEPQAAFYSWINACGDQWREQVSVGDRVLVIDVGGGTTDLSLIAVEEAEGNLHLRRIAVGNHILLGGDNMDLALAYRINQKLADEGKTLQPWQIQAIVQACRDAKESLLDDDSADAIPIAIPSRGSRLIGGTLRTELTRNEVVETLVEGFFPEVGVTDHPKQAMRRALSRKSLPYAQDPAISRHLAAFLSHLTSQEGADNASHFLAPTAVLLNGGVFKSHTLTSRLLSILNRWLTEAGEAEARLLEGADLDLAVARGAAVFNQVRQGRSVRIRGGIANAYYVGIESAMPAVPGMAPPLEALCVAPFGMEEGSEASLPEQELELVVGEPVRFRFFGSNLRREDQAGDFLDHWSPEELTDLPEIEMTLEDPDRQAGALVPVYLESRVTELGTLQMEAVARNGQGRWQVEFNVREQETA